jgi:LEA14-like dessication related protein
MRKKLIAILFAIVTIVYIVVGVLLFFNIQIMEAPEVLIEVEVIKLNSDEAVIHTTFNIDNPNAFEIVMKNLELVSTTPEDFKVAHVLIKGEKILAHEKKTFSKEFSFALEGKSPDFLINKITGEIGANIWFIQKTIFLNIGVITKIENLTNEISIPSMSVTTEFIELTKKGINLTALINMYNPNTFDIYLEDISSKITTETNEIVGNLDVKGGVIFAKKFLRLNCNGTIQFEALNAEVLTLNISGNACGRIAGYEKNLTFTIQTEIKVPDLEELLLSKNSPTILSIKLDQKFTLRGIIFYSTLEIDNRYKIDIQIKDIKFKIFEVAEDTNRLLGENEKIEEVIAEAGTIDNFSCEILVPYSKIFPIDWSTDWVMATVSGRVSINGVEQSAYLEIRGYQSLHPIR